MFTIKENFKPACASAWNLLQALAPGGAAYRQAFERAATLQLEACLKRIHTEGLASDGSPTGSYSSRPLYVNPARSGQAFAPAGKQGRTVFARSGRAHTSAWFGGGYAQWRAQSGLPADRVLLSVSGGLRQGLRVMKTNKGFGLGWPDEASFRLALCFEKRYGKKIWAATEQEKRELYQFIKSSLLSFKGPAR